MSTRSGWRLWYFSSSENGGGGTVEMRVNVSLGKPVVPVRCCLIVSLRLRVPLRLGDFCPGKAALALASVVLSVMAVGAVSEGAHNR